MGIAQAGLAFRLPGPRADIAALVSEALEAPVLELASPLAGQFDIRRPTDVMVLRFEEACFLCNVALAEPLLHGGDAGRLHRALGAPPLLFAFRHDDEAGSYGYALFERGVHARTRVQTAGTPEAAERGEPYPFERRWLAADHFVEGGEGSGGDEFYYLGRREVLVPAGRLTGRLLQDGLEACFDVCPWETLITPGYRFYRVEPQAGAARAPAAPPRPWWRRR